LYEDGVPQQITSFNQSEAPITAVLLVDFASTNYYFIYDMLNAAYNFANSLKPQDWIAVVSYDMKPHIMVDFTQDKRAVFGALNQLRIPGFSETNLFDALYDTLDRLDRIEGRKEIVLISTGRDTFSKLNLDQILKKVKSTPNVTIFAISIGRALREWAEAHGYMGSITELDFLQADNQMNTFARMTGGQAFFPRFEGELPEIFHDIGQSIRNQYTLAYHPTNPKLDGTYRKIKVEVVAPNGGPLRVLNEKKKEVKYQVIARDGYTAKHQVE
jgi:VWFA-related protein